MDLICTRCGEPEDFDYVMHEMSEDERADFKAGVGCRPACARKPRVRNGRTATALALSELMGDDMDGTAAMLEDAEMMGLIMAALRASREERVAREMESLERNGNPDSPYPPPWFDPADIGEVWEESW